VVEAGCIHHSAPPGVRSGGSGSLDSHEDVSEERKLQRMKTHFLVDQGGQKSSQTHVVEEVSTGSPLPSHMPKAELETTYLIKEVFPLLDNRGMAELPHTNIRGAKMA
jgi:hypothetical protein